MFLHISYPFIITMCSFLPSPHISSEIRGTQKNQRRRQPGWKRAECMLVIRVRVLAVSLSSYVLASHTPEFGCSPLRSWL